MTVIELTAVAALGLFLLSCVILYTLIIKCMLIIIQTNDPKRPELTTKTTSVRPPLSGLCPARPSSPSKQEEKAEGEKEESPKVRGVRFSTGVANLRGKE